MRIAPWILAVSVLVALLVGCEPRQSLGQGEAVAVADNFQRREGVSWGSPLEVLPPASPDASGHRWWQMRYADEVGGPHGGRIVVVDADSGWARLPPPGYALRVASSATRPSAANPVTVQEGRFILLVTPPAQVAPEREAELEREAARLNALGGETGLFPVFSLRKDRDGRTALVYGWQGDRGIARDERVSEWLRARTPYGDGTWIDLLE